MTSLDAKALHDDADGLAFLRDVLKTAPAAEPASRKLEPIAAKPAKVPNVTVEATRRTGLIGATALAALIVVVSPAKPATPDSKVAVEAVARPAGALVATADPTACPRVRRKLWVEGEGWVVRAVAKC